MNKILRLTLAAVSLFMMSMGNSALDLPIRKVNGKEVYCYKVKNKETVYGLSKKLGVTREEIVRYNPSASDGLKKNMMLFFPVEEFQDRGGSPDIVENGETTPDSVLIEEESQVVAPLATSKILILLPFGNTTPQDERKAKFNADFYRGFLLAADSLSNRPGEVHIEAIDLNSNPLSSIEDTDVFKTSSLIIGPDDEAMLEKIAEAASRQGTYVLNVMNMRDTLYRTNPYMMQANIPQSSMYELATQAIEKSFPDYTPVLLHSVNGKNEKEPFVNYLKKKYQAKGIEPVEISYEKTLNMNDLSILPVEAEEKYIIVPSSGSLTEFNSFSYVLKSFRDKIYMNAMTDTTVVAHPEVAVFGYPDWTAFRGDALDMLHKLDATVYSRFCDDINGFETRNVENSFRNWFGLPMMESVPTPGLLGFDTGWYVIKNIRMNDGSFNPLQPTRYRGIQSVFQFVKPTEDSGYVNNSLFIIKYLPGGQIEVLLI